MSAVIGDKMTARAEFYLCLAHAFLSPIESAAYDGLTSYLADDLRALSAAAGYDVENAINDFEDSLLDVDGPAELLQLYAWLFLVPPVPVRINAGLYLDGAIRGGAEMAIEDWYRRHGLARSDQFRDRCDHVSAQLEFVAVLYAAAAEHGAAGAAAEREVAVRRARQFLGDFPRRWVPPFCDDLARAASQDGVASTYGHLARILRTAIAQDVAVGEHEAAAGIDSAEGRSRGGLSADRSRPT